MCYASKTLAVVVMESLAKKKAACMCSFTPAWGLFPKYHVHFIDISGHLPSRAVGLGPARK